MKLMNFRALDPEYTEHGKVGLTRGGQADRDVWGEFANDATRCHEVATAISAAIASDFDATLIDDIDDTEEAAEGRLLTRLHRSRERNQKLVATKKARTLRESGGLKCEVCGFDFRNCYGERGDGFIECHHTRPVHTLVEGIKIRISDLALLCANCHRMIHVRRPWLSVEELRVIISHKAAE